MMTERWERAAKTLGRDDRGQGVALAGLARRHSSEAFFGCDTVLEAGVFSALAGICRDHAGDDRVDP